MHISLHDGGTITSQHVPIDIVQTDKAIYTWLEEYAQKQKVKILAAGIGEADEPESLGERLWLKQDIVPFLQRGTGENAEERSYHLVQSIAEQYTKIDMLDVLHVRPEETRKVTPGFLTTFEAYKSCTPEDDLAVLHEQVQRFKGLEGRMVFINSTPQGGGVALMRHALMRLYRLLGVHATWYVMYPRLEVFDITKKKFHNILQGVAPGGLRLDDSDKEVYNAWMSDNRPYFEDVFRKANVVVIDDYQPSGLIALVKEINPQAKIMYRSHIHIDTSLLQDKNSPQSTTWNFIWEHNRVSETDIFISHPIQEFVPDVVPSEKIVLMPATTDPVDGLNKHLSQHQMDYYMKLCNALLADSDQKALDTKRPYIIQVARFDPSKGIPDVLESYRQLRERYTQEKIPLEETPQLVIAGHGAVDDPEGIPILEETKLTLEMDSFESLADDIKLIRLPHNDQILNALMQGCRVALQLSHKEGLEVKVSEALNKGKPIIIYRAGGMPLQVVDKSNAFVLPKGHTHEVAEHLYSLLRDDELYAQMSKNAQTMMNQDFFTVRNAYKWLFMANELLEKGYLVGNKRDIKELMGLSG